VQFGDLKSITEKNEKTLLLMKIVQESFIDKAALKHDKIIF